MGNRRHLILERVGFGDIFDRWEPYRQWAKGNNAPEFSIELPRAEPDRRQPYGMRIGTFCSVKLRDRTVFLRVWPKPEIAKRITDHTIHIDGDYLSFQIIQGSRQDCALVTCDHGRIIGGVWVADIDLDSIPQPTEEDQP